MDPRIQYIVIAFVCLFCADMASAQKGGLLYLGESDFGWQVCHVNLDTLESKQLTSSIGDKRSLRYDAQSGAVFFRDAAGNVMTIRAGVESELVAAFIGCSSYDLDPVRDTIYFTRLATNNPQRQFVWEQGITSGEKHSLFYRPLLGSIRQLRLSPDRSRMLGTHVSKIGEERIILMDIDSRESVPVSSPMTVGAYPAWSADGRLVYYSKEVSPDNYDLFAVDLETMQEHTVFESSDASEFSASPSTVGVLYFESRGIRGSLIKAIDLSSGDLRDIPTLTEAREPLWVPTGHASNF